MSRLRSGLKIAGAVAVTLPAYLAQELSVVLAPWPRLRERWRSGVLALWGRLLGRVLGLRVTCHGTPPRAPFLLVANHLSYADVLLLGGLAGGTFVAKAEIRGWPGAGRVCHASGVVFVDRDSKRDLLRVGQIVDEVLQRGRGVILFAEGTTSVGRHVLPLRPSLLEGAARAELPVHYATITYRVPAGCEPAARSVCWVGDESLVSQAPRFLALPRVEAVVRFGEEPIVERDRKLLARRLHAAMSEIFEPTTSTPEPPDEA